MTSKPTFARRDASVLGGSAAREQERALVVRAASGDAHAARAIVDQHHGGMYALALRLIGDPVEAEDLVQEAFARAFSRLEQFDPTYRLSTWLYRIVLNSCRDHLRSPRRRERPCELHRLQSGGEPSDPGADPMLAGERALRLRLALAELRPQYKEIIVLKDVLELSYDEIHSLTGTAVTGLKIRALRARARLRKLLGA